MTKPKPKPFEEAVVDPETPDTPSEPDMVVDDPEAEEAPAPPPSARRKTDMVTLHHPETGGTFKATRLAFDSVYSAKGWILQS